MSFQARVLAKYTFANFARIDCTWFPACKRVPIFILSKVLFAFRTRYEHVVAEAVFGSRSGV